MKRIIRSLPLGRRSPTLLSPAVGVVNCNPNLVQTGLFSALFSQRTPSDSSPSITGGSTKRFWNRKWWRTITSQLEALGATSRGTILRFLSEHNRNAETSAEGGALNPGNQTYRFHCGSSHCNQTQARSFVATITKLMKPKTLDVFSVETAEWAKNLS